MLSSMPMLDDANYQTPTFEERDAKYVELHKYLYSIPGIPGHRFARLPTYLLEAARSEISLPSRCAVCLRQPPWTMIDIEQ